MSQQPIFTTIPSIRLSSLFFSMKVFARCVSFVNSSIVQVAHFCHLFLLYRFLNKKRITISLSSPFLGILQDSIYIDIG